MRAQTVRIPNRLFPAWNTLTKSIRTTIADQRGIAREDIRTDDIFERLINMAAAGLGVGELTAPTFGDMEEIHAALEDHRCRIGTLEAAVSQLVSASLGVDVVVRAPGVGLHSVGPKKRRLENAGGPGLHSVNPKKPSRKGAPIRPKPDDGDC